MIDKKPINKLLRDLKSNGNYRVFNDILRERGEFPKAIWYGPYNIKNIVKITARVFGNFNLFLSNRIIGLAISDKIPAITM